MLLPLWCCLSCSLWDNGFPVGELVAVTYECGKGNQDKDTVEDDEGVELPATNDVSIFRFCSTSA